MTTGMNGRQEFQPISMTIFFLPESIVILNMKKNLKWIDMYEDIYFPEYGRQVELIEPVRGYYYAHIIGRNGNRFIVQFSSGMTTEVYPDEINFE